MQVFNLPCTTTFCLQKKYKAIYKYSDYVDYILYFEYFCLGYWITSYLLIWKRIPDYTTTATITTTDKTRTLRREIDRPKLDWFAFVTNYCQVSIAELNQECYWYNRRRNFFVYTEASTDFSMTFYRVRRLGKLFR